MLGYVPHDAYLVWIDDPAGLSAAHLPLQWHETLSRADRLSPDLVSSSDPTDVSIQVAAAGRHDAILDEIRSQALAIRSPAERFGPLTHIRASLPAEEISRLASYPEVLWVEPFERPVLHDERSDLTSAGLVEGKRPLAPGYLSWLASQGFGDLSGIVVDLTDTGIDTGGTQIQIPGLKGRIAYAVDRTGEGQLQDCAGHGTHVAGTIAGLAVSGSSLVDPEGYLPGLGMAPSIRIGVTRVFGCDGVFSTAVSFTDLVRGAFEGGARIGNNSWGSRGAQYNTVSAEYDALVRDADRDSTDGDQQFLPVFSAGNLGPSRMTVGWPATAKNVLTVGASENFRPSGVDGCGVDSSSADNVNDLLLLSSRGPTADGRIKPDLVAPGSHIQSLASSAQDYSGVGVCDAYYPPGQHVLNWSSGTSHSAPHVTASAAIASEAYERDYGAEPSPAMIKAMLINHARDMGTMTSNVSHRPSFDQGWGRVDLGSLLAEHARVVSDQEIVFRSTGEEAVFDPVLVADPSRPVAVTLVWTDAPGKPGASSWVNDLDLLVQADSTVYRGNVFKDGFSIPGGQADFRNNVENVILPAGRKRLTVRVTAANIAGDGIPSLPGLTDQDFALYISNARSPTRTARLSLTPPRADCGSDLSVHLLDARLTGLGRALVTLRAGPDRETAILEEDPPMTGAFLGTIDVRATAPAPGDGVLQVADGLTVEASFTLPDAAGGTPVTRSVSVPAHCSPPTVTDIRVARTGASEATITWRTDRPADSTVLFGTGEDRSSSQSDPKPVMDHSMRLTGLPGCTFHTATVKSTDAAGQVGEGPDNPVRFSTGPGGRMEVFRDDMGALGSAWTHRALSPGAADDWELGFPAAGPPVTSALARVWGTNLDGDYSTGADAVLTSPIIDLRGTVRPELTFQHFFRIWGGNPPRSENDGGWVEISSDGGSTWAALDPPGGYPDLIDRDNPYLPDGSKVYAGVTNGWIPAVFDLSPYAGRLVRIRFHFWQDAGESTPRQAGWFIDDVEVTAEASCHEGRLVIDSEQYGCSSPVRVTLYDTDLDTDATVLDTATVQAIAAGRQMDLTLSETEPGSAQFRGVLPLSPHPAAGTLEVAEGDQFTIRYADEDEGGGVPAVATVSAQVLDCAPPPPPTGVTAAADASATVSVSWTPVDAPDLQGYRVYYDDDSPGPSYTGIEATQGSSPVRSEDGITLLDLTSLTTCSPHFIAVTAFDGFGNESAFSPESVALPTEGTPCPFARIVATPAAPGCDEPLQVTVFDSNADPDPAIEGSVTVTGSTPTGNGPLAATLTETAPSSHVFTGSLPLAKAPAAGSLTVSEGDVITVSYTDSDDGTTQSRIISEQVTVGDCTPPMISSVRVTRRGPDRAVVTWTTDEPGTSRVEYGPDASLGLVADDPVLTTQHSVPIMGLTACSPVSFIVSSRDAHTNASSADDNGTPFTFGTFRPAVRFSDDMEAGEGGWTHRSLSGSLDEWEMGAPLGNGISAPSTALSGGSVWATDLDGPYEQGADLALVTPPIDLPDGETASLTFQHWYDITTSGAPNGFDDGAFVEVSTDDGATWTYITPVGGYPDLIARNPYTPPGARAYAGSTGRWEQAKFLLDAFVGRTIRLRFHLVQDRAELSPPGNGWYIDDVRVAVNLACHAGIIRLAQNALSCSDQDLQVQVQDRDLDIDPLRAEQATVLLTSLAEPAGELLTLGESAHSSGVFRATILLSRTDAPGTLAIQPNDIVRARYDDADDGTGTARVAVATAPVTECSPPTISDVLTTPLGPHSFRVEWTTSQPADSRLLYGTDPALPLMISTPELVVSHAITVTGLDACTRYSFTVASRDAQGNLTRDDAQSGLRMITTNSRLGVLSEDFTAGAPGWKHHGQGDAWTIAGGAASHAPGGTYDRPRQEPNTDFVLVSPPMNLDGLSNPILSITHRFDFPRIVPGGDGGRVEGWDGVRWIPLDPIDGYPGLIDRESDPFRTRIGGFNGTSQGLETVLFDLSPLQRGDPSAARFRFRVFIESGVAPTATGWRIEKVDVSADTACRAGRLVFDHEPATCAEASIDIALHDKDLDQDPLAADTTAVSVDSSGGPAAVQVPMVEAGIDSGLFTGTVSLSASGAPGTLRARPGDTLRATYLDADDGTGQPRTVVRSMTVSSCDPPAITGISLEPTGGSAIRVRWVTDQPSTGEVTLAPATGPPLTAADLRLVTQHEFLVPGAAPCGSYAATLTSSNVDGIRAVAAEPADGLFVENFSKQVLFSDDMEGPDPGWSLEGFRNQWERGTPTLGPPTAFSGQSVFGTGLDAPYLGGTNATLVSPPIDLAGAVSPRLTFWHWYDVFASDPPNSIDDAAFLELEVPGQNDPVYIAPIGGYPDTTDNENGQPLPIGTPVFSGSTVSWEKAVFDLTPFAGKVIRLRFRLWNDIVELLLVGVTGAGWYIDDVEVSAPQFCHPAPTATATLGSLLQGGAATDLVVSGSGFRPGARVSLGPGVSVSRVDVVSDREIHIDLTADRAAPLGTRDLVLTNPDGQSASVPAALRIDFSPAVADINRSGRVDGADLGILARAFGAIEGTTAFRPEADLNNDGFVDGMDLALLAANFGRTI
ncbi:MAG: S8 family serine peptidase [Acidobacteriota bacterium]